MLRTILDLRPCFFSAVCFATSAAADQSCFKQNYVKEWAEKFSYSEVSAKDVIYSTGMPKILDEVYDRFIDQALKIEDTRSAFETFEVEWNIQSHESQIPDYELVPRSLRPCIKWMWNE